LEGELFIVARAKRRAARRRGEDRKCRQKALARELEWVRASPKARQAKSKARLQRYETMLAQDQREKEKEIEMFVPPGPRLGDQVVVADKISKAFGDNLLFTNVSFSLPPGGIVGVIGRTARARRRSSA